MKKRVLKEKLAYANSTVASLFKQVSILEKQLSQQDKAIERKDKQFLGLRSAYQDELINKM